MLGIVRRGNVLGCLVVACGSVVIVECIAARSIALTDRIRRHNDER